MLARNSQPNSLKIIGRRPIRFDWNRIYWLLILIFCVSIKAYSLILTNPSEFKIGNFILVDVLLIMVLYITIQFSSLIVLVFISPILNIINFLSGSKIKKILHEQLDSWRNAALYEQNGYRGFIYNFADFYVILAPFLLILTPANQIDRVASFNSMVDFFKPVLGWDQTVLFFAFISFNFTKLIDQKNIVTLGQYNSNVSQICELFNHKFVDYDTFSNLLFHWNLMSNKILYKHIKCQIKDTLLWQKILIALLTEKGAKYKIPVKKFFAQTLTLTKPESYQFSNYFKNLHLFLIEFHDFESSSEVSPQVVIQIYEPIHLETLNLKELIGKFINNPLISPVFVAIILLILSPTVSRIIT